MRKGVDFRRLARILLNTAQASQSVHSIDVHGARTADTLSTRSAESEGGIGLILDLDLRGVP